MVKKETDDFEEFEEEVQEEPVVEKSQEKVKKQSNQPVQPEERYYNFIQQARTGIIDRENNEIVGEDTNTILTAILNKLDNLEKSTG